MRIGYARVSTEDQKLDLQRDALRQAACGKVFQEKRSGATEARPALDRALAALKQGDVFVVWKLDRLGRSMQDLVTILETLNSRGVAFCSLTDGIDTTTPTGKLLYHITGAMAEFERSLMSERTKAGMAAARRKGRKPGRPRLLSDAQVLQVQRMAIMDNVPLIVIAMTVGVSKTTVWRAVDRVRGPDRVACGFARRQAKLARCLGVKQG